MKCKFCNAEMEDGENICPVCGKDNQEAEPAEVPAEEIPEMPVMEETEVTSQELPAEEPPKKKKKGRLAAAIVGGIAVAAVLVGAIAYGSGMSLKPRPNDVFKKDSYTVEDQKALKDQDVVIATLGDQKLTNSELKIYYEMNKSNFLRYYGSYISMLGLDPSKPLDEQEQDKETGMTWQQFFLQNSLENWQRYAVLTELAKEEGFEPSDTAREQMEAVEKDLKLLAENAGFASIQEMVASDMGPGATEEAYLSYMRTYYENLDYYDTVFERIQPTDEEIEAYYDKNSAIFTKDQIDKTAGNYVDVRHILVTPKDGTQDENGQVTYSEEQWAAGLAEAQKVLDQWKAGEATEESFAKLAMELTADGGSRQNGGLYTNVVKGQMVKPFEEWCFDASRQKGDTGIVKTEYGYHIMYFVNSQEIWKTEATSRLLTERTDAMLQEGMERWPMEVNYKKIVLGLAEREKPKDPTVPATEAATTPATEAATTPATEGTTAPAAD